MGYISDQNGIVTRYARECEGWNAHLIKTKNYILNHCCFKHYKTISIIGSGWLLDVPINEIINEFDKIYLIDIIHPFQIKHKYRKIDKIIFIELDATGGLINSIYEKCKAKNKFSLDEIKVPELILPHQSDIVVSLNILNQLDILLVDYLKENIKINDFDIQDFRGKIQQSHINFLSKFNFCLITDFEEEVYENEKIIETRKTVFPNLDIFNNKEFWDWKFDNSKMYYEANNVNFKVIAFTN